MAGCILWVRIDIFHNTAATGKQQQARCLFHNTAATGKMPVPQYSSNRQDACSTTNQLSCGTGILPVRSTFGSFRVLKSANVTTYRLTALVSIMERISGIIGNLLYGDQ
ncbi:MAG: hypothetical protein JGK38_09300 [Microcoleus sp. PH2017_15_JOR_U_A]|uniref:hypothetical protein n=3 Tax=unclassified Microcoleus TaxID=2642155 RepID=UPI001D51CE56|nr:hypothetical protein [Microcoleus sp. PH2017_15_JOR_U_A]MCC3496834.1 hypothetical protein [Microcoleus sp. PH2017_15_JOR_U_A]